MKRTSKVSSESAVDDFPLLSELNAVLEAVRAFVKHGPCFTNQSEIDLYEKLTDALEKLADALDEHSAAGATPCASDREASAEGGRRSCLRVRRSVEQGLRTATPQRSATMLRVRKVTRAAQLDHGCIECATKAAIYRCIPCHDKAQREMIRTCGEFLRKRGTIDPADKDLTRLRYLDADALDILAGSAALRTAEAPPVKLWDPYATYAANLTAKRDPATCRHPGPRVDMGVLYCHGCASVVPELEARGIVCVCGHPSSDHEVDGGSRACDHGAHGWTCECMAFTPCRESASTKDSGATIGAAVAASDLVSAPLADREPGSLPPSGSPNASKAQCVCLRPWEDPALTCPVHGGFAKRAADSSCIDCDCVYIETGNRNDCMKHRAAPGSDDKAFRAGWDDAIGTVYRVLDERFTRPVSPLTSSAPKEEP
jgi:hypothetical protein